MKKWRLGVSYSFPDAWRIVFSSRSYVKNHSLEYFRVIIKILYHVWLKWVNFDNLAESMKWVCRTRFSSSFYLQQRHSLTNIINLLVHSGWLSKRYTKRKVVRKPEASTDIRTREPSGIGLDARQYSTEDPIGEFSLDYRVWLFLFKLMLVGNIKADKVGNKTTISIYFEKCTNNSNSVCINKQSNRDYTNIT